MVGKVIGPDNWRKLGYCPISEVRKSMPGVCQSAWVYRAVDLKSIGNYKSPIYVFLINGL